LEESAKGSLRIEESEEVAERFCRREKDGAYSHSRELLGRGRRDCVNNPELMQCEVGGNIRKSLSKTPM